MDRLTKIGSIKPKNSIDVQSSRLGIGFEKLDRDVFDPNKAYDKVAELGVKWVRLQSGWQKTEKVKGVYDFDWLDKIVDNLIVRGLKPWMCLAYGNGLYTKEAAKVFGAVGCPPIETEEERVAWDNYVQALVRHFDGRVELYEVWNEPNWFWSHIANEHQPNGTEYGDFVIRTSIAAKKANPNAKIIGGVESVGNIQFMNKAFATGMADYIDFFSFHMYTPNEKKSMRRLELIRGMCDMYKPELRIIQGETGAPSRSDGNGELSWGAWTPEKQAKTIARHAMCDLMSEVEFGSYFSSLDMIEALNGTVDNKNSYMDYAYFGLLGAEFDENGFSTGEYTPKPSYKALQNIASVFANEFSVANLPVYLKPMQSERLFGNDCGDDIITCGFKKPNGSKAYVYWYSNDLMTTKVTSTTSFSVGIGGKIRLVDLLSGDIYDLRDDMVEYGDGYTELKNIPITDYPMLLIFGNFCD